MHKKSRKPPSRKIVLRLPDLDHTKAAVLHSLGSPHSRRNYKFAMEQFITWYCSEPRLALNPAVASPRTSSGTSFGSEPKRRSWTSSLHMIFVGPVQSCATPRAVKSNRSSSYFATRRYSPPSDILAANRTLKSR